jgi:hypothetical protein
MRDFSSKGSTNEAFLLVRAVQGCAKAVQSMEINYKVCNKSEKVYTKVNEAVYYQLRNEKYALSKIRLCTIK